MTLRWLKGTKCDFGSVGSFSPRPRSPFTAKLPQNEPSRLDPHPSSHAPPLTTSSPQTPSHVLPSRSPSNLSSLTYNTWISNSAARPAISNWTVEAMRSCHLVSRVVRCLPVDSYRAALSCTQCEKSVSYPGHSLSGSELTWNTRRFRFTSTTFSFHTSISASISFA